MVWKSYSPMFRMCGNLIPPHLQGVETIFPHIYNVRKPYSPHLLRVETLFPNFYKVWNQYSPTLTRCGNLIPPLLPSVETLFPHVYKVWKPYPPTFTECGNLIPNTHSQGLLNFPRWYQHLCPIWTPVPLPSLWLFNHPHLDPQTWSDPSPTMATL